VKKESVILNNIKLNIFDSSPERITFLTYSLSQEIILKRNEIQFDTNKILFVGDHVSFTFHGEDYKTKVNDRIYYPQLDYFDFICNDLYTGVRE
jgi:hypothetical protein